MLKKTITYTDYNGTERTENYYFNLNKVEITEMELSVNGGLTGHIQAIIEAQDRKSLFDLFKEIILKAYGEKSVDGKRFVKSKELSEAFSQTEAFNELVMEIINDDKKAAAFIQGILPFREEDLTEEAQKELTEKAQEVVNITPAANLGASL